MHEALFYDGRDEFLEALVPFVRDAVAHEEPILAVLAADKIAALRQELGQAAEGVLFADMAQVGTNPARIIPAWQEFVGLHGGDGRRIRGIGEPVWPERSPAELSECGRHEALLNAAFPATDFWLVCPYDTGGLDDAVLDEARRNHPLVRLDGRAEESSAFPGLEALAAPFAEPLPAPPSDAWATGFGALDLAALRRHVGAYALLAGLDRDRACDLVVAVNEIAGNSVRHAGGRGTVRLWREPGTLVCEVSDDGRIEDPLAGRRRPDDDAESGRGLWMANQLCELVQVRTWPHGGAVRLHVRT